MKLLPIISITIFTLHLMKPVHTLAQEPPGGFEGDDVESEIGDITGPGERPTIRRPTPSGPTGGSSGNVAMKLTAGNMIESIDYKDADLAALAMNMSEITGKKFIVDKDLQGKKITIISKGPVTIEEAYRAFLSALEMNDLTIVPSGKFSKIIQTRDASRSGIPTYSGDYTPDSDQYITRIYHLNYISAQDLVNSLRDLAPRGGLIAYQPTNSIIITDTGTNISRLLEIIQHLDVKGFKETLEVIPIKYGSASDIANILNQVYSQAGASRTRTTTFGATTPFSTLGQAGPAPSKIIPDERTNSLIILARQETIDAIKKLIAQIDFDVAGGGKIHVYYLQFADAEELAKTLVNLAAGKAGGKETPQRPTRPEEAPPTTIGGAAAVAELTGEVKVTSDKATNSLVIQASPQDYEALKVVIEQLDISRKQVYLEASIIELTSGQTGAFGVSYTGGVPTPGGKGGIFGGFRNTSVDSLTWILAQLGGTYATAAAAPVGGQLGYIDGHHATINIGGTDVTLPLATALIQTLVTETDANLLSAPRILVLDNEEAKIKVGSKQPVTSSAAVTGTGISQQSIERIPVVLELKITPQINEASDFVKLKVSQSIEAVGKTVTFSQGSGGQASSIETTERAVESTVVVKDKDTVVLGGLMQDNVIESESKIPLLGDIPILGWAFKVKTSDVKKTNLVLFLTPTIIHKNTDFRNLFDDVMQERQQYLDKNIAGDDKKDWYINRNLNPPKID